MGGRDDLCLLCGISPWGGPLNLLDRDHLHDLAREIVAEIHIDSNSDNGLLSIVTDALASSLSDDDRELGYRPLWLPEEMGARSDLDGYTWIAIGYFDNDGKAPVHDGGRIPDGRNVEVRRVREYNRGDFNIRVVLRTVGEDDESDEEELRYEEVEEECYSACSVTEVNPHNPNFWLCEKCYQYLTAWVNRDSLPSRSSVLLSVSDPASLAGELYEIVNSQKGRRLNSNKGLLPCIDYGGIEHTLQSWQDFFAPARQGSQHVAKGIQAGLRGVDLIPSLMKDFRCWMFMRPDIWPEPTDACPTFIPFESDHRETAPTIAMLPLEVLILILCNLPVASLLSLAASCRYLRAVITDSKFINCVLREALLYGSLRWILPAISGEIPHAKEAASLWLSKSGIPLAVDTDEGDPASLFAYPQFPYLAFVHACFESDSMRNRNRIWSLVQQFEGLWRKYRMDGWEVDRFYAYSIHSRIKEAQDSSD